MAILMVLPALAYYVIANPGRSTEYFFAWTVTLIRLIMSPDFYSKWIAMLGSLFGLTILSLSILGSLLSPPRIRWMLVGIWIGYLLYGITLPFQMYTHSYYHVQIIPVISLGLVPVANLFVERMKVENSSIRFASIAVLVGVLGYYSWVARSILVAEDFRYEPVFWQEVGKVLPEDAKVIALTQDYGYRLMLWGWRKVTLWPINTDLVEARGGNQPLGDDFNELTAGMDYFLVTAFGQLDKQPALQKILDGYPVAAQGEGFFLYDLHP